MTLSRLNAAQYELDLRDMIEDCLNDILEDDEIDAVNAAIKLGALMAGIAAMYEGKDGLERFLMNVEANGLASLRKAS